MSRSVQQQLAFEARQREQKWQNDQCECAYDTYISYAQYNRVAWVQLYTCQASYTSWMDDNGYRWYALRSYHTIVCVACMGNNNLIFYDILRKNYTYTVTSAQHIAKFRRLIILHIYTPIKPTCATYTWRAIL